MAMSAWLAKWRNQAVTNPQRTLFSIKRFMGRRHSEVSSEESVNLQHRWRPDDW